MPGEEMTFARTSPSVPSSAAQVSSQLVSRARITGWSAGPCGIGVGDVRARSGQRRRRAPHDQGVLAVVLVIAAAQARGAKADLLVQRDRRAIGGPDLEGEAGVGGGGGGEPIQQRTGGAEAAAMG